MDFVAIDFETATSKWTSICSMGICTVENGVVTDSFEFLVKPEPFEFNKYNIMIHGITPSQVADKPTFDKCWDRVKPYLEGKLVVAHNASFDVGVLKKTLEYFDIELPTFDYLCTVKLSQRAYPQLESHKLNYLGEALGINFSHHNACADAYACAEVLNCIMRDYDLTTCEEISDRFGVKIGRLSPDSAVSCRKVKI